MIALLLACTARHSAPDPRDLSADPDTATGSGSGAPLRLTATVEEIAANPLAAAVRAGVSEPAAARLTWDCGGHRGASSAEIGGDGALEGVLEVWGVPREQDCDLSLSATSLATGRTATVTGAWRSGDLTDQVAISLAQGAPVEDLTILTPNPRGDAVLASLYAVGVDGAGEVVWAYTDDEGVDQHRYARPMPDGTLWLLTAAGGRHITPGGRTLSEIANPDLDDLTHDICPLPDGDILLLEKDTREIDVPALGGVVPVFGVDLVRLAPDGAVRWVWTSFDHLDTERFPGTLSQTVRSEGYDWLHANAVSLNPDGRTVLLSLRHQSWILQIDLGTGEVDWILGEGGDFTLTAGEWFYNQHGPEMTERGTVLVYDNGNERPDEGRRRSRAVEYRLDPDTREAAQIWEWPSPYYTSSFGNARLLEDGNILADVGNIQNSAASVVELTPDGTVSWQIDADQMVYRAERTPGPEQP